MRTGQSKQAEGHVATLQDVGQVKRGRVTRRKDPESPVRPSNLGTPRLVRHRAFPIAYAARGVCLQNPSPRERSTPRYQEQVEELKLSDGPVHPVLVTSHTAEMSGREVPCEPQSPETSSLGKERGKRHRGFEAAKVEAPSTHQGVVSTPLKGILRSCCRTRRSREDMTTNPCGGLDWILEQKRDVCKKLTSPK